MNYEEERLSMGLVLFFVLLLVVLRSCVPLRSWEPGCTDERETSFPPHLRP